MYPSSQNQSSAPPYQPYGQPIPNAMGGYGVPQQYQQPYPNSAPPQYMNPGYARDIFLPNLPWTQPINGFTPPQRIRMVGYCGDKSRRFELNLRKGMDHFMHLNVRFDERVVVRNSSINGTQWLKEEREGRPFPFKHGSIFTIDLIAAPNKIAVLVNGLHYCDFNARDDPRYVSQVEIAGDVHVHSISIGL